MLPTSMSSVTLRGIRTTLIRDLAMGSSSPASNLDRQPGHMLVGSSGLQWKGQSSTCVISGRTSEKDLTRRDLPEPLGPETRTPPMVGSIALRTKAIFALSWPTTAVNG